MFALVEEEHRKNIVLNFAAVGFLSSSALGKLITLEKKVKASGGKLRLSNIRPEIYEVFAITKLNKLFEIKDDEAEAWLPSGSRRLRNDRIGWNCPAAKRPQMTGARRPTHASWATHDMTAHGWHWKTEQVIPSDNGAGKKVLDEILGQLAVHDWGQRDIFGVHLAAGRSFGQCHQAWQRL